jgi:hypothetical protein|tara:strand:+ start:311 stop:547 length:237 start_codon:yes stop_codon:yes gene_type:complete
MALSIIAKSEFRKSRSIIYGYGEVPEIVTEQGAIGWGLMGGLITHSEKEAIAYAYQLDKEIRARMKHVSQLNDANALK